MPSIFEGLDIAQRALYAQQVGLEVTQRNVANTSTPGYTKLRVNFEPSVLHGVDISPSGTGIAAFVVDSFRNSYIEYGISRELQGQGEQEATLDALQQVEALFSDSDVQGLQKALSEFFGSFSSLANTPEDLALRQDVLQKAGALADEFRRVYDGVKEIQLQQDRLISDMVGEVNVLSAEVARLNTEISAAHSAQSMEESNLRDSRQSYLNRLSELLDVSYYEDPRGMVTVTTKQGALLVAGNQSKQLDLTRSPLNGLLSVSQDGADVTSRIQSGKLGGALNVRDSSIAGYLTALDDLAAGFVARVNEQHALGADLDGVAGGDFFVPFVPSVPGSNAGAARSISVAITDPRMIAAAGLTAGPGSNANANLLAGIKDEDLASLGTSADQFYANLVYRVAADTQRADNRLQTQKQLIQQLQNQRDAFSGVSLDEEAVNIIKYQKAYQASARFVTVIDTLTNDLLRILGG
jgi:flagellar hook-associated protein 1 FlgK